MRQEDLQNKLDQLSKTDLALVLLYAACLYVRHLVGSLRPIHILLPVTLSQITLLVFAVLSKNPIPILAVGNVLIVSVALIPSTIRLAPAAHWL